MLIVNKEAWNNTLFLFFTITSIDLTINYIKENTLKNNVII